jgi:hypothetical protein
VTVVGERGLLVRVCWRERDIGESFWRERDFGESLKEREGYW